MIVEIISKKKIASPYDDYIKTSIKTFLNLNLKKFLSTKIFKFESVKNNIPELKKIAKEILTDPITEYFKIYPAEDFKINNYVVIDVWYKPGVLDAVAESVKFIIKTVKLDATEFKISTGKRYYFLSKNKLSDIQIKKILNNFLMNPLIQFYYECKNS